MKTATITDFRQNMKEYLDEIQEDQDILVLTGPKKKHFVILTLDTFNAMEETAHFLSTSANTIRLMESIAQDKAGKASRDEELKEANKLRASIIEGYQDILAGRTFEFSGNLKADLKKYRRSK